MLRLSQQGKLVDPRAVKVDNQWKILFSQAVVADDKIIGSILAQLPTSGLRFALNTVDIPRGIWNSADKLAESHRCGFGNRRWR